MSNPPVGGYVVPTCPHCGAPIRELVDGGCPFCRTPLVATSGPGAGVPPPPSGAVVIHATGRNKISVIKAVREHTGLGLKESKDLVDAADRGPTVIARGLDPAAVQAFVSDLQKAGAQAGPG